MAILRFWRSVSSTKEDSNGRSTPQSPAITEFREKIFWPATIVPQPTTNASGAPHWELPGIPYRVDITPSTPVGIPGLPEGRSALRFDSEAFRIGLNDGYHRTSLEQGVRTVAQVARVDQAFAFPVRAMEADACRKARAEWLSGRIAARQAAVKEQESLLEELSVVRSREIEREREEKTAGIPESITETKTLGNPTDEIQNVAKGPQSSTLARLVSGLFMVCCGFVFLVADVSLSTAAIYGLGFRSPVDLDWKDAISNIRSWGQYWDGVFLCFGIAAMTVLFKYFYERVIYPDRKTTKTENAIILAVLIGCLVTVSSLGLLRAHYLVEGGELLVKRQDIAFWAMFLTSLFFPIAGAVSLSEGLHRTFGAAGLLMSSFGRGLFVPLTKIGEQFQTRQASAVVALEEEMERCRQRIESQREELSRLEIEHKLLSQLGNVWNEALKRYQESDLVALDEHLYRQGYQHGESLRSGQGPYELLTWFVARRLLAADRPEPTQPDGSFPSAKAGRTDND